MDEAEGDARESQWVAGRAEGSEPVSKRTGRRGNEDGMGGLLIVDGKKIGRFGGWRFNLSPERLCSAAMGNSGSFAACLDPARPVW